jgi:hypothetical protein
LSLFAQPTIGRASVIILAFATGFSHPSSRILSLSDSNLSGSLPHCRPTKSVHEVRRDCDVTNWNQFSPWVFMLNRIVETPAPKIPPGMTSKSAIFYRTVDLEQTDIRHDSWRIRISRCARIQLCHNLPSWSVFQKRTFFGQSLGEK